MEPWDAVIVAEYVLRELISTELGSDGDLIAMAGVSAETVAEWEKRRDKESVRRPSVKPDGRLLYYAHLGDLSEIIFRNWAIFSGCLGDKATIRIYFDRLLALRNAIMHGRDLAPFERYLAIGISGDIRNRVAMHRSTKGPDDKFFPRIEQVRDSFGNLADPSAKYVVTGQILHPGDTVSFECHGWDPDSAPFDWHVQHIGRPQNEIVGNTYTWEVKDEDISVLTYIAFILIGSRPYHRLGIYDEMVQLEYAVLPNLNQSL